MSQAFILRGTYNRENNKYGHNCHCSQQLGGGVLLEDGGFGFGCLRKGSCGFGLRRNSTQKKALVHTHTEGAFEKRKIIKMGEKEFKFPKIFV